MNCQVCGNDTIDESDICDDCADKMPKPAARLEEKESVDIHRCEGIVDSLPCPNGTVSKFGSLWLCDTCKVIAKSQSGDYQSNGAVPEPEKTTPVYDPDQFVNISFEEVFKRIFNDYAPRVAELSDEALLQRILYHRRAQEIDRTLEGIVLGEKERRMKTRKGAARDRLASAGIPGTKAFPTQPEQDKADKDSAVAEKSKKSKLEKALDRLVKAGGVESEIRKILGI
jgi:hypothetical protein